MQRKTMFYRNLEERRMRHIDRMYPVSSSWSVGKRVLAATLLAGLALSIPLAADAKPYRIHTAISQDVYAGDNSMQNGLFQKAEARYTAALKTNPNDLHARAGLSLAQAELF